MEATVIIVYALVSSIIPPTICFQWSSTGIDIPEYSLVYFTLDWHYCVLLGTPPLHSVVLHFSMQFFPSGTSLFLVVFCFFTQLILHCLSNSILYYSLLITHSTLVRYYKLSHMTLELKFTSLWDSNFLQIHSTYLAILYD